MTNITRDMNEVNVPGGPTKYIHLQRNTEGQVVDVKEVVVDQNKQLDMEPGFDPFAKLTEAKLANGKKIHMSLSEAALNNPDSAEILRTGIRFLAFERFKQIEPTFTGIVNFTNSSKPQEEYLRDAAVGTLPLAPSGTDAPELVTSFEGGVTIQNNFYRGLFSVLGDWIRFDNIGKIRQLSGIMGRALAMTREDAVYSALTTTGNYGRNSTTKDNDVGANTAATTFNGTGLELALATIATSKDRRSGAYLGYKADTIVIGPRMEVPVKQLLMSTELGRQGGNTTNEVRGTGSDNTYRGLIKNIIVTPWFPTGVNAYQWLVFDSSVEWFEFQEVMPPNVMQENPNISSEAWLVSDKIRFLAMTYFGCGIIDDRAA